MEEEKTPSDREGQLDRKMFQELYASFPDGGKHIEAKMFPALFPMGIGVFDQNRPGDQPTFAKYREHLLSHSDGRFRNDQNWLQWSSQVAGAIEAKKRGENIVFEPYTDEESKLEMEHQMKSMSVLQRTVDPLKVRNALRVLRQTNPTVYASEKSVEDELEEKLAVQRLVQGNIIKECSLCHAYPCPENPNLKLSKCSKCHHVFYCGREHQVKHWPTHKQKCKHLAKMRDT